MILAIDPSYESGGLGYAFFNEHTNGLESFGVTHPPKREQFEDNVWESVRTLKELIQGTNAHTIVIEMAESWGSYKSQMISRTGVLHKLFFFIGALYAWGKLDGRKVILIPPRKWKGQLPKAVTKKRVEKYYAIVCKTQHEADAIGLGLHYLTKEKHE